jgi:mRNA interferase RelE/StbE
MGFVFALPIYELRQQGYRLVYSVADEVVIVTVIAVGKRDRNEVYEIALSRLNER